MLNDKQRNFAIKIASDFNLIDHINRNAGGFMRGARLLTGQSTLRDKLWGAGQLARGAVGSVKNMITGGPDLSKMSPQERLWHSAKNYGRSAILRGVKNVAKQGIVDYGKQALRKPLPPKQDTTNLMYTDQN